MSVIIRTAQIADYRQLVLLFSELDRLHRENVPWLFQKPETEPRPEDWLKQCIENELSTILVADTGECVGLVTVELRSAPAFPLFIPQRWAVIDNLFVAAAWRRQGIAREFYKASEAWAREHEAAWIEANVYDFNGDGLEFYDALGLSTTMRKVRKPLAK